MSVAQWYTPNADEAACAWVVAKRRNSLNRGGSNIPGGETATNEERLLQHYRAGLAEIAVSRLLNLCWTGCGRGAEAGVKDVGGTVEVRSIDTPTKGLLARTKDHDDDPCVLVCVHPDRTCEILGWEYYGSVKLHGRVIGGGTSNPCWILAPAQLRALPNVALLPRYILADLGETQ